MSMYAMIQAPDLAVLSHNLDDSLDPPAWQAGSYNPLTEVSYDGAIWKALEETSSEPGADLSWKFISSINFNRMLEDVVITRTKATSEDGSIELTFRGSGNFLTLMGLRADFVTINGVQQDLSVPVNDMWQYYANPIETKEEVFSDVVLRDEIHVVIERVSSPAELGKLFLGREFYMGELQYDPRQRMTDYSLLERDAEFGYVINQQQRGFTRDIEGELRYPVDDASRQFSQLANLRSRPALFINKTLNLLTYGALRQIEWQASKGPRSIFTFYIEGYV